MVEYQRVIAEINLDNIAHNVREIKKKTGNSVKLLAVVKADAYGHGAVEVSKVALYNGADWLGVAECDEGVQLRRNNIFVPVLLLGYTPEAKIDEVILNGLTQTIFSFETAEAFSHAAARLNKTAQIHIKIDTGMGRIGFLPCKESVDKIVKISQLPNIDITGIYTHFAASDEKDKSFSYEQYNKFKCIAEETERSIGKSILKHAANSGAILDLPDFYLDMVREGIILYGLYPSEDVSHDIDIRPAMSIKTHVSFIKTLEKGISVGYGRTYFTDKETVVATIPVGYADGYSRLLSNRARVIIGDKLVPVIGNICMDQFMTDISMAGEIKPGDEVILIGEKNGVSITADELAKLQGTISYEILCGIGKRVPRVYIKNGEILKTVNYGNYT